MTRILFADLSAMKTLPAESAVNPAGLWKVASDAFVLSAEPETQPPAQLPA